MVKVLVVEDHEDTAATLGVLLRLYGHDVEVAADGSSALLAVQARPPDVVLLDIGLPKINGWLVARQIREQTGWKRPLLVAVTGYGTEADRLRSDEVGMDLHLVKPVDPETLARVLERFESIVIDSGEVAVQATKEKLDEIHHRGLDRAGRSRSGNGTALGRRAQTRPCG